MAENKLFPTFNMPELTKIENKREEKYRKSIDWDFEIGDFKRDGAKRIVEASGKDAYIQWCIKMISTERFRCFAYPKEIGCEIEAVMHQPSQGAAESTLERTITEALLVNPRTEYIRNFSFIWNGDSVSCEFVVKGKDWEEFRLNETFGNKEVKGIWQ
jgi:Protein of unknown function (DUF2634).